MRSVFALSLSLALSWGMLQVVACGADEAVPRGEGDAGISIGGDPFVDASAPDGDKLATDGGFMTADGAVVRADRFVTKVVSFTPGSCAGFGRESYPDVVYGPPVGGGRSIGGLDVLSLGIGGEIVLSFEGNAIVDSPGVDFIVFENAFLVAGNESQVAADLAEVSVSEDGVTWKPFPCSQTEAPYGACAGWHPVYATPSNGISPFDPVSAGGDLYDLADVGLSRAKFVKIVDKSRATCPAEKAPVNLGFDLDAIASIHSETE